MGRVHGTGRQFCVARAKRPWRPGAAQAGSGARIPTRRELPRALDRADRNCASGGTARYVWNRRQNGAWLQGDPRGGRPSLLGGTGGTQRLSPGGGLLRSQKVRSARTQRQGWCRGSRPGRGRVAVPCADVGSTCWKRKFERRGPGSPFGPVEFEVSMRQADGDAQKQGHPRLRGFSCQRGFQARLSSNGSPA